MRLPELFLLGSLVACAPENTPKTGVDIAMSTQRAAATNTLTMPATRTAADIASDAAWILSAQSQKNSLGQTNCENGTCPNIQALCTAAPDICVEAFDCAVDRFGLNVTIGYRDAFRGLEEQLEGMTDVLPQRGTAFIANECFSD